MTSYPIEQLAKSLKAAREAKGLSQRALSERVGMPQSHISRIERGGVNLRLANLVEIARALDLEVTLVPRKHLAAVRSITQPRPALTEAMETVARSTREFQRLQNTIARISRANPAMTALAQLQRRVNDLSRLKLPRSALEDLRKINASLKLSTVETDTLRKITESLTQVQHLYNQHVNSQVDLPGVEKIRPVYSLEEDDHG